MNNEEKSETLAGKAKAQFDALKTQEGRDALKDKVKEGAEGAKKLWNATSIAQRIVVLVAVVLMTIFLTRSCGSNSPAAVAANDTPQGNPKQDEKAAAKFDQSVDLTKTDNKNDSMKSFVGFEFGTSADKFNGVEEVRETDFSSNNYLMYYKAILNLKNKFRLFDRAVLRFTQKDKRLYKITLQTQAEKLTEFKPTAILKEAQYCAAIIEKKYGVKFSKRNSSLYSTLEGQRKKMVSNVIGSHHYSDPDDFIIGTKDSNFAISPSANYHGFFNNTIEIKVSCGPIGKEYLGITITAMDHGVIEEEGGRTKDIPLDADDDESNL